LRSRDANRGEQSLGSCRTGAGHKGPFTGFVGRTFRWRLFSKIRRPDLDCTEFAKADAPLRRQETSHAVALY
jgi:hypothetical protein